MWEIMELLLYTFLSETMAGLKLGGHPHLTVQLLDKQQHLVYILGNFIILFKYNLVWQNHRFSIIMFITKVEYM